MSLKYSQVTSLKGDGERVRKHDQRGGSIPFLSNAALPKIAYLPCHWKRPAEGGSDEVNKGLGLLYHHQVQCSQRYAFVVAETIVLKMLEKDRA